MLTSLKIKNFRALEDFEVTKLGRVNLIVGKNNSGKSSVLEALQIFAGNAAPALLDFIASAHDEIFRAKEVSRDSEAPLPYKGFFFGRRFPQEDGQAIEIGDPLTGNLLKIEHGYFFEAQISSTNAFGETVHYPRIERSLKSEMDSVDMTQAKQALFVQKGERTNMIRFTPSIGATTVELPSATPCSMVPTLLVPIDELASEWDKIALTASQNIVQDALRLILTEFEALTFVRNEGVVPGSLHGFRTAKVKLANHDEPVPLNSLGEGMLRVLQLVLKIFSAKGGFLLVDEFENGLHYSVQEKIWALVFDLAAKLDIQVYATTHSWDCIENFAKVANARKEIQGVLFRIGRSGRNSDKGRVIATVFDEEQLMDLTQSDVEVR